MSFIVDGAVVSRYGAELEKENRNTEKPKTSKNENHCVAIVSMTLYITLYLVLFLQHH